MNEHDTSRVASYVAFLRILDSLYRSPVKLNREFIDKVIYSYAPLDYIDTHYNLSRPLREFRPTPDANYAYEGPVRWTDHYSENDNTYRWHFGDMTIDGDLEIGFMQRVFITGSLNIKGVLEMDNDSRIFVGKNLSAAAVRLGTTYDVMQVDCAAELLDIRLVASTVNVAEVLYTGANVYAGEVNTKLAILNSEKLNLDLHYRKYQSENQYNTFEEPVTFRSEQTFAAKNEALIGDCFNRKVLRDYHSSLGIVDTIFYMLKDADALFDDHYNPLPRNTIWASNQSD